LYFDQPHPFSKGRIYMGMGNLNLIVKFRDAEESGYRVKRASRMMVEGDRLTLVDPHTGAMESLPLARIEVLSIRSFSGARRRAKAA
jgi:hypothetical protein